MRYKTYKRNHVIYPGRDKALHTFLNSEELIDGELKKHKLKYCKSSNSEDALTWSCFDVLRQLPQEKINIALNEIMEDAFDGKVEFSFKDEEDVKIEIGKKYNSKNEHSELDASIETKSKLIFFEAKLYNAISLEDKDKPYDQIIKKLRTGLECAKETNKEFYFIFLDIAPIDYLKKFGNDKAISAIRFENYKVDNDTLKEHLKGIQYDDINKVKENMGWLTWACLFKTVLRAIVS